MAEFEGVSAESRETFPLNEGAKTVTIPLKLSWTEVWDKEAADAALTARRGFDYAIADTLMRDLYIAEIDRQVEGFTMAPLGPRTLGFKLWFRVRAQHKVRQARLRLGEWVAGEKFGDY